MILWSRKSREEGGRGGHSIFFLKCMKVSLALLL